MINPFLLTSEIGSYARATIVERKPQLIRQMLEDNPYPAPIISALRDRSKQQLGGGPYGLEQMLVHTGQHYDRQMSAVFFEELGLPVFYPEIVMEGGAIDVNGSGTIPRIPVLV